MTIKHIDSTDSLRLRKNEGVYERRETAIVREQLKPGHVFVDVGAHIGYYSAMAAELVGTNGKVFAFEPNPTSYALLVKNTAQYGDIVNAYRFAVSDRNEKGCLYLNAKNSGDHRMLNPGRWSRVNVKVVRLDDVEALRDVSVDFMKIDVQGAECGVLRGAAGLIGRSPGMRLIIEYAPAHLIQFGVKEGEFFDLLRDLGIVLRPYHRPLPRFAVKIGHCNLYGVRE